MKFSFSADFPARLDTEVKRFNLRVGACLTTLILACSAAAADPETVAVSSMRDPVDKSYRKIIEGMDLFERLHALAPSARLRFKLLPRRHDTDMAGIILKVVGDTTSILVPIAADQTFELQRSGEALAEDAAVMPNRKAGSLTWRAEIRTPGLPPNTRRLGDLRLECKVGREAGLVSNQRSFLGQVGQMMQAAIDYCDAIEPYYLFFSDYPLFNVTMRDGDREQALSIDKLYAGISRDPMSESDLSYCDCQVLLDRTYFLPLGDRSWSDDTLVEVEYIEDLSPGAARRCAPSNREKAE